MKVYIYTLSDPDTKQVMYVGQTENPRKRLNAHISKIGPSPREKWIASLRENGKAPVMTIVQEGTIAEAEAMEKTWLDYYKAMGCQLVNSNNVNVKPTPRKRVRIIRRSYLSEWDW